MAMAATAMMPIVFSVVKTSIVQMFVAVVLPTTLRILDRLLVTKLHCFLFFWHCVVSLLFGFVCFY